LSASYFYYYFIVVVLILFQHYDWPINICRVYKNKKCYYEFNSILLILFSTLKFKFYFNNK